MDASHISQTMLGRILGVNQSQVSARLRGAIRWSLDDVDRLADAGVPITLTATTLEKDAS
jgi:hypothetical protein